MAYRKQFLLSLFASQERQHSSDWSGERATYLSYGWSLNLGWELSATEQQSVTASEQARLLKSSLLNSQHRRQNEMICNYLNLKWLGWQILLPGAFLSSCSDHQIIGLRFSSSTWRKKVGAWPSLVYKSMRLFIKFREFLARSYFLRMYFTYSYWGVPSGSWESCHFALMPRLRMLGWEHTNIADAFYFLQMEIVSLLFVMIRATCAYCRALKIRKHRAVKRDLSGRGLLEPAPLQDLQDLPLAQALERTSGPLECPACQVSSYAW